MDSHDKILDESNNVWDSAQEFERIYNRYATLLVAYGMKFVSQTTAQDIVQDIFLVLWNNPPALKSSIKSYLFASVRNACLDHLKNMQVREKYVNHRLMQLQMDEIMYYQENDESIIEEEQLKLIHDAIGELPEKCKQIFEMCYFQNMKSGEIAEQLHISVRTVQNHLYKGLLKLRKSIDKKTNNGLLLFAWIIRKIIIYNSSVKMFLNFHHK